MNVLLSSVSRLKHFFSVGFIAILCVIFAFVKYRFNPLCGIKHLRVCILRSENWRRRLSFELGVAVGLISMFKPALCIER